MKKSGNRENYAVFWQIIGKNLRFLPENEPIGGIFLGILPNSGP